MEKPARKKSSRSCVIETAVVDFVARRRRLSRDRRDLEIINRNADALNAETMDVLDYQIKL